MNIKVRDLLGDNYSIEDAILLREIIRNNLDQGAILDFDGYDRVPSTFLINLSNYRDYSRVVLGTAFQQ